MIFREILRTLIDKKKITITELSELSGIHRDTIHRILSGRTNPKFDTVVYLMSGLNTPVLLFAPDGWVWQLDDFYDCLHVILGEELITQKSLAERTGVHATKISQYARGLHSPSINTAIDICEKMEYRLYIRNGKNKIRLEKEN